MSEQDFLIAIGAVFLLTSGLIIGCHMGVQIERRRWLSSVPTIFPSTTKKHWQKKEPIDEKDL